MFIWLKSCINVNLRCLVVIRMGKEVDTEPLWVVSSGGEIFLGDRK